MNHDKSGCPMSLFNKLGGQATVIEMVDKFYYKVLFDKTLRHFYVNSDMARVRFMQKEYLSKLFGAENIEYKGRDIIELHKNLGIDD